METRDFRVSRRHKSQLNEKHKELLKMPKCKINCSEESERSNTMHCTAEQSERSNILYCTGLISERSIVLHCTAERSMYCSAR